MGRTNITELVPITGRQHIDTTVRRPIIQQVIRITMRILIHIRQLHEDK